MHLWQCVQERKRLFLFSRKNGLEFLWRLRTDTRRRLIRLIQTFIYFIKGKLKDDDQNIVIKKFDIICFKFLKFKIITIKIIYETNILS